MKSGCIAERLTLPDLPGEPPAHRRAFGRGTRVRCTVALPKGERADSAVLRIHRDGDGEMTLLPMESVPLGAAQGLSAVIDTAALCGEAPDGLFTYCYDVYYPAGCVSYGGEANGALSPCREDERRQLLVCRAAYETPEWLLGGILYHIFVDRFRTSHRSAPKPGVVLHESWDEPIRQYPTAPGAPVANNEFFGGDLYGIIEKLDYIASLGVTCLYLSPIFDAASNHKYDTGDYEHVDAMFGGDEALTALFDAAAARGIRVILDGVFNHTGADSRYFNRFGHYDSLGAYQSPQSPYAPWYHFTDFPNEYDCWWGVKILPRVACDEPSYRAYMLGENGVVARWLRAGAAGFRLDVADELSDGFLEAFRRCARRARPDAVIYGEVWEDATNKISYGRRRAYLRGAQLDSVMNYPLRRAILRYIREGDAAAMRRFVDEIYRRCPKPAADLWMNFIGTHDTVRALTALGGEAPDGASNAELAARRMPPPAREKALARLRLAYALLIAMPGIPCIFYGDEAGVEGYGDPFCRRPYPWGREDESLLADYRALGQMRRAQPVLRDGEMTLLACETEWLALLRDNSRDTPLLLLLNRSEVPLTFTFSCPVRAPEGEKEEMTMTLAPLSARFTVPASTTITVSRLAADA